MTNTSGNKPIHVSKFGCARAAVWKNENGYRSVTVERIYKDEKEDSWKSTQSFGRDDLPKLIKAIEGAYESLFATTQDNE